MDFLERIEKPSKEEQKTAMKSYSALEATLESLYSKNPEIEIEETQEKIRIPKKALILLAQILKATSEGKSISIVPIATEMTTQQLRNCSVVHDLTW